MNLPRSSFLVAGVISLTLASFAQDSSYRLPPAEIVKILDAPPTPRVDFSPDARWMLLVERRSMPSIAEVTKPWIGLAGLRVDPALWSQRILNPITGLSLREVGKDGERRVPIPKDRGVGEVRWCHDSTKLAYTLIEENGLVLYCMDVHTLEPKLVSADLNAVFGSAFDFSGDAKSMIVRRFDRAAVAPKSETVPAGPVVQETAGSTTPLRTYQDLLDSKHAEDLFAHYGRSQIVRVDLESGSAANIGTPALYIDSELSPDGKWLLVTRVHAPFSYVLPYDDFPQTIELWSLDGKVVRTIAEVPMGEHIPQEGVRIGPRNVHWQASAPASLVWAEALDGGDPKAKAEFRDRWMRLAAPFDAQPAELVRLAQRARGLAWMQSASRFLASEYDRDRRWLRTLFVDPSTPQTPPKVIDDRSVNDRYKDPGMPVSVPTAWGTRVVYQDGTAIYRAGRGETPQGSRPFFDRCDLSSGEKTRLWQCAEGRYEAYEALAQHGDGLRSIVIASESPSDPPNYKLVDLQSKDATPLTEFTDPTPELRGMQQELVTYARADGVKLSATMYVPKNRLEGERLPLFVWAYPLEYTDASTAGQVSSSPYRFVRVRGPSHLLLLTQGYAVLDAATMPVVGDPETMNDTFVEQIVSSAKAAIDKAVEMGVADRERVAVGGHSYGAFMTANLLAHCDLFKTGIARSGAYNRTLTPFGFQSERRTLWEAPKAYEELSPFFFAQKINEPLLMIHGEKDSNLGTFPMQSERMYQAIKGNGGTARLVLLPGEDHGYQARESVMHTVAEMVEWLDRYVKGAAPAKGGQPGALGQGH